MIPVSIPPVNMLPLEDQYEMVRTGGYWMLGSQTMHGVYPANTIADMAFDPCEELIWCVSGTGQLTGYYGSAMEIYTSTPVRPVRRDSGTAAARANETCELKAVYPDPRYDQRYVYALATDALFLYHKFGHRGGFSMTPEMRSLVCMSPWRSTHCGPNAEGGGYGVGCDIDHFMVGGFQPEVFQLDAVSGPRWGAPIRTIDVGPSGAVALRPFAFGICAANSVGEVKVIDPRALQGVVRTFRAHTGEISDMTVLNDGHTLITCGWSSRADGGLRIDRQVNVFDLRFAQYQAPVSCVIEPTFVASLPGRVSSGAAAAAAVSATPAAGALQGRVVVASQEGAFQSLDFASPNVDPEAIGNLLPPTYDRVSSFRASSNGQCLLFGMESGSMHLYSTSVEVCRFNDASMPTEFASSYAEGLIAPLMEPLEGEDDEFFVPPSIHLALSRNAGKKMMGIVTSAIKSATAATEPSFYPLRSNNSGGGGSGAAEQASIGAAARAISLAHQPVADFDAGEGFSASLVPFDPSPPPSTPAELAEWVCSTTGLRRVGTTSDWPADLLGELNRPTALDPKLLERLKETGAVAKPAGMGNVWCPYDLTPPPPSGDLELGSRRRKRPLTYLEQMCRDA